MSLVRGAVNKWVFNRWGKMVEGAIKRVSCKKRKAKKIVY